MADYSTLHSQGGTATTAVPAGSGAADVVVSSKPGRLTKIYFIAAATATLELYDHASASSGAALIWKSPTTVALGVQYDVDIPVANGIVALQANGSGLVCVGYTVDGPGAALASDKALPWSEGGQYTSTRAAGASGAGTVLTGAGRMCKIVMLAQGSAATDIYDNTAASGKKIFSLPASGTTAVAAGTVFNVQVPVANGIYYAGATNTSQVLISYSKTGAYGR